MKLYSRGARLRLEASGADAPEYSQSKMETIVNRKILLSGVAAILAIAPLHAEETLPLKSVNKANEVIDAALAAHGGAEKLAELNSLIQESEIINYATGQSRRPDPPWDRAEQTSLNAIDFEKGIFVSRNAGVGGGFVFEGSTIINGENSWQLNYRAGTAAPIAEPDLNTTSGPFIRVTPALLMKQLQSRRQFSHWLGVTDFNGRPHDVVTLVMEVGPGLSLYIDQETHMLTRMERVLPPFGQVEYRFEDYALIDGIAFNKTFRLLLNDDNNLEITNKLTRVNAPVAEFTQVADTLREIPAVVPDDFKLQEIDEGVFLVGGTSSYGLFVEMNDYIVAIGGTQGVAARLTEVRKHISDKPVRYGVLTHHHSDHVPGASDYAAEGATIITFKENETVVRNAAGDEDAKLEFVNEHMSLTDGERTIELYDIGPTPHAEHLLIAYLPQEKIIFEADHFSLPRTGPMPPASPATFAFAEALARLELDYNKVVGAHSPRIGSPADLQASVEQQAATAAGAH
jgi:glyoxylase-like metal-dependent hydrolase (beta-lactamase superfamily II)